MSVLWILAAAAAVSGFLLFASHRNREAIRPPLAPSGSGDTTSEVLQPSTVQGQWVWPAETGGIGSYWELTQDGSKIRGSFQWGGAADVWRVEGKISETGAIKLRDIPPPGRASARYEGQLAADGVIRGVQITATERHVWTLQPGGFAGRQPSVAPAVVSPLEREAPPPLERTTAPPLERDRTLGTEEGDESGDDPVEEAPEAESRERATKSEREPPAESAPEPPPSDESDSTQTSQ